VVWHVLIANSCSFQTSQATQVGHLQALDERLRAVLEQIENDKAATLAPGQPLLSARLNDVESARSLLLHRHVEESLDTDRESIRAASMQVSSLVASTNAEAAEAGGRTTEAERMLDKVEIDKRKWITISLIDGGQYSFNEYHRCKILTSMESSIEQVKLELLKLHGAIMERKWISEEPQTKLPSSQEHRAGPQPYVFRRPPGIGSPPGAPLKRGSDGQLRTTDLTFFYGFAILDDKWRLQDYAYNDCIPQIICFFADASFASGAGAGDSNSLMNLRVMRKFVSRRNDFEMDGFFYLPARICNFEAAIHAQDHRAKAILSQALAWTTIGMTYDDSRGKYTAVQAYGNAASALKELSYYVRGHPEVQIDELKKTFAAQIKHLHTYPCRLGEYVTCFKNTKDGRSQEGEVVRVLAVVDELKEIKVMKRNGGMSLLEAAWDLQDGWVKFDSL